MVISKEKALFIAKELCKKKLAAYEKESENLRKVVSKLYSKQVPPVVKALYKKYPEYVKDTSYAVIEGHGISYLHVSLVNKMPGHTRMKLTPDIANQIKKANWAKIDAKKEYDDLVLEVKTAIITLKTYARITEKFPEAAKLLPSVTKYNPPAIQIDKIRDKLK